MKPNYELLKEAYAIIGGIPDCKIRLHRIVSRRGASLGCGTVCCAGGWLAQHPTFKALGVSLSPSGDSILVKGQSFDTCYSEPLAEVFGIGEAEAFQLFTLAGNSVYDKGNLGGMSEKEVWLRRVRRYLSNKGQL